MSESIESFIKNNGKKDDRLGNNVSSYYFRSRRNEWRLIIDSFMTRRVYIDFWERVRGCSRKRYRASFLMLILQRLSCFRRATTSAFQCRSHGQVNNVRSSPTVLCSTDCGSKIRRILHFMSVTLTEIRYQIKEIIFYTLSFAFQLTKIPLAVRGHFVSLDGTLKTKVLDEVQSRIFVEQF